MQELNLDEPLYIGGVGEKSKRSVRGSGHFNGAIERISLNGLLWENALSRASKIVNIQNYQGPPCGENPCKSGKCIAWCMCAFTIFKIYLFSNLIFTVNSFICHCAEEFHGLQCEQSKCGSKRFATSLFLLYFLEMDTSVKLVRFDNFYFVEYDSNYFPQ